MKIPGTQTAIHADCFKCDECCQIIENSYAPYGDNEFYHGECLKFHMMKPKEPQEQKGVNEYYSEKDTIASSNDEFLMNASREASKPTLMDTDMNFYQDQLIERAQYLSEQLGLGNFTQCLDALIECKGNQENAIEQLLAMQY